MLGVTTRLPFCIFSFCILLSFSGLDAQNVDSLNTAIDEILNDIHGSLKTDRETLRNDSLNILMYLSEGARLRTINSDSSLFNVRKALYLSLRSKSLTHISLAMQDLGGYYLSHEMYRQAMTCYLTCLMIEEKRDDRKRMADLYDDLGSVYYYMEVFDKSLDYYQKALVIYNSYKDTLSIAGSLSHLGTLHSSREFCEKRNDEEKLSDFKIALNYFEKAIIQFELAGNKRGIASSNQNIAAVYNKMNKPDIALGYVQKALDFYREINDPEGISGTLYTMGKTYYRLKEFKKSVGAYKESEEIALRGNLTGGIQYLYEAMAMPYYDLKDYKNAYDCYIKYMTLRDSVYNTEKSKQIIELETRYQSKVKQNEILRLTSEKRRRNNLLYLLSGVIVMLGSYIYYFIRLVRKNKIISEQNIQISERKIRELEKERLYLAARSVMEGEEAERSRLAGDLHNGLGGLLSGIKINLSQMKENAVITHENVSAFNHAISLLDTSISELRRIAHNLMPETLNHYGLKTALEDFCSQIDPAGQPRIVLQFFGDEIRFTKELELSIYRIIQELVNNALKHSGANLINIQVFSEPKRLFAQVTDNGKGFDSKADMKAVSGKGLVNIRDRVTALNGKLDIWSQPGQGTEIGVEILIS
jgi:signal transduction histidine kinase